MSNYHFFKKLGGVTVQNKPVKEGLKVFLKPVKVKQFADSRKYYGLTRYGGRKLITIPNDKPDDVFYIVGVTSIKEGIVEYDNEYGYSFSASKSHKVYIVAKSIGRRFKVLERDIEKVEVTNIDPYISTNGELEGEGEE
jgi:hypothetical protein